MAKRICWKFDMAANSRSLNYAIDGAQGQTTRWLIGICIIVRWGPHVLFLSKKCGIIGDCRIWGWSSHISGHSSIDIVIADRWNKQETEDEGQTTRGRIGICITLGWALHVFLSISVRSCSWDGSIRGDRMLCISNRLLVPCFWEIYLDAEYW